MSGFLSLDRLDDIECECLSDPGCPWSEVKLALVREARHRRRGYDLVEHLKRQKAFSRMAFGPGARVRGIIDHIRSELAEVEADPADVYEWIDLAMLAFDGAWRAGWSPKQIAAAFEAKLRKNEQREWPDWRKADLNKAIEHVRDVDGGAS